MIDNPEEQKLLDTASLSQQSGVRSERIARYAEHGLIAGPNPDGMYDEADLVRLRLIGALIESGMAEEATAKSKFTRPVETASSSEQTGEFSLRERLRRRSARAGR